MLPWRTVGLILLAFPVLGCVRKTHTAGEPTCSLSWQPQWSLDSSLAVCVPPGFVSDRAARPDEITIKRYHPSNSALTSDLLTIALIPWSADSASIDWPPTLVSGPTCLLHCMTVDSLISHQDTVGGIVVSTEVGLMSGGMMGWQRKPGIKAGWILSAYRRGWGQGFAENSSTLDTLRHVIGSSVVASVIP